jgi:hypothetical protein
MSVDCRTALEMWLVGSPTHSLPWGFFPKSFKRWLGNLSRSFVLHRLGYEDDPNEAWWHWKLLVVIPIPCSLVLEKVTVCLLVHWDDPEYVSLPVESKVPNKEGESPCKDNTGWNNERNVRLRIPSLEVSFPSPSKGGLGIFQDHSYCTGLAKTSLVHISAAAALTEKPFCRIPFRRVTMRADADSLDLDAVFFLSAETIDSLWEEEEVVLHTRDAADLWTRLLLASQSNQPHL